MEDLT
jgi:hypothetical protein